jgi:hypothetical protein
MNHQGKHGALPIAFVLLILGHNAKEKYSAR